MKQQVDLHFLNVMNRVPDTLSGEKQFSLLSENMSNYKDMAENFKRIRKIGPRFKTPGSPIKRTRDVSPAGEEFSANNRDNITIDEIIAAKQGKLSDAEARKIVFHSQTRDWMRKR